MSLELLPSKGRLVVKIIVKEKTNKYGLILPAEQKEERYVEADVLSVHPEVTAWKAGDVVMIDRYTGHHPMIDEVEHIIIKEEEILATVKASQG
jgi:chaperonin GroES